MSILDLPGDVLLYTIRDFADEPLIALRTVCKQWRDLFDRKGLAFNRFI